MEPLKMPREIDFVIPWVDGNDPDWQREFNRYKVAIGGEPVDISPTRYLDWELLPFLFRGIEKFAPWVRTVHFVTNGQLPPWLNCSCPRLHCVAHSEFMSPESLPTFSSHPIELQLHKIPGLAEQFVYFNDDIFLLRPIEPSFFFQDGKRVDMACEERLLHFHKGIMEQIDANNLYELNRCFPQKRQCIEQNREKWGMHPGKGWLANHCWRRSDAFAGFTIDHLALALTKQLYETVWENCGDTLEATIRRKFRSPYDVNSWLLRYWSFASGNFYPAEKLMGKYYDMKDGKNSSLIKAIRRQEYPLVCANDTRRYRHFEQLKSTLKNVFEEILPDASSFEK